MTNEDLLQRTRAMAKDAFDIVDKLPELMQYDIGQQLKNVAYEASAAATELAVSVDLFEKQELLLSLKKNLLLVENGIVLLSSDHDLVSTVKEVIGEVVARLSKLERLLNSSDF